MDISNEIELSTINMSDAELAELEEARSKRELFEQNISNIWGYTPLGMEAKRAAMSMLSTKTGLYATVPIHCKTESCPYAETCLLLEAGLAPYGQKCPMETAMIETRYVGYEKDYGLDGSSFTDNTIIAELINLDVTMERSKALLAAQQTAVEDVVFTVTENGEEIKRPEISKAWELYERASNRRDKALDLMLGTRKSRKGTDQQDNSLTDILAQVYEQDFIIEEKPQNL